MKKLTIPFLFLLCLSLSSHVINGQNNLDAKHLLQSLKIKWDKNNSYEYDLNYEAIYYSTNYNYKDSSKCYFKKINNNPDSLQFIGQKKEGKKIILSSIYAGHDYITLFEDKKQYTVENIPLQKLNNSYLRRSILMISKAMGEILNDESALISIVDTSMMQSKYTLVIIEPINKWLSGYGSWKHLTDDKIKKKYLLIVDKKTQLPVQFISQTIITGEDKIDFERFVYKNVIVNKPPKTNYIWKTESIVKGYKPFVKEDPKKVIQKKEKLPSFSLPSYQPENIGKVSLDEFKDQIILIDFWFKACGPCQKALPHFNEIQQKYMDKPFKLITINVEDNENDMAFFHNKLQPTYPMLFKGQKYFNSLGFSGCPTSLLINKNGEVENIFIGFDQLKVEKAIEALFK